MKAVLADIPTVEEIKAAQLRANTALDLMEQERRAADKVVSVTSSPTGIMALTETGRLFHRQLDSRNFDGRNPQKYVWVEVEGPLS